MRNARCCIAMPKKHPLSSKGSLVWDDLNGETMLLVKPGSTPVLDAMRTEIENHHSGIHLMDIQNPYNISVFNECDKMGYIMETLDIWSDVHPSLVTIPMEWEYEIPVHSILLDDSSLSVSDIAVSCGFDNISYFIRKFKEYQGVTPKQYRSRTIS